MQATLSAPLLRQNSRTHSAKIEEGDQNGVWFISAAYPPQGLQRKIKDLAQYLGT
jgi:hypothetical protein